jgi:hypothetical protein
MINYKYILLSFICLFVSIILIVKNKFYKRKDRDMLWATGSNFFLASIVLAIFALFILYYELKKLF